MPEVPSPEASTPPADDEGAGDEALPLKLELTSRQQRRLWSEVLAVENFWETLPEIEPGTIGRIAALAERGRWETIFLTKRPSSAGATTQIQTQRWLERYGIKYPSVYVIPGSRGLVAAALTLDVIVDDRPENCLDVSAESRSRAILVWREDAQLLPAAARRLGIGVVSTMQECLDVLAEIDATGRQEAGVFDRVMRALGLRADSVER